jgi:hypothetical protein
MGLANYLNSRICPVLHPFLQKTIFIQADPPAVFRPIDRSYEISPKKRQKSSGFMKLMRQSNCVFVTGLL